MSNETTAYPEFAAGDHPPRGLELLYGVLFRPRDTYASADLERSLGMAALVIALVSLIYALTGSAVGGGVLVLSFFTWLGFMVISWLMLTALLFVITHIMRPQGSFAQLLAATGLSFMPWILEGPLAVFARWGGVGIAFAAIGTIAVFVWWIRVLVAGIRGATGLTAPQSLTSLVMAELVLIGFPLALFVLMMMGLVVVTSG